MDQKKPGGDLLSHTVSRAVPSALRGLTAVFGMGTGVSLSPKPPECQTAHPRVRDPAARARRAPGQLKCLPFVPLPRRVAEPRYRRTSLKKNWPSLTGD